MRTSLIASAALAVPLFAGGALAEQHGAAPGAMPDATTTTTASPQGQAQAGAPAGAVELIGMDVLGTSGEQVGEIKNVLVNEQGRASHLVVAHGGWLGMGEKEIALAFDQLQISDGQIRVTMTNEQLARMPEYESPNEAERAAQAGEVQTREAQTREVQTREVQPPEVQPREQTGEAGTIATPPGEPPAPPRGQDVPPDAGAGGSRLDATPGVMADPVKPRPAD